VILCDSEIRELCLAGMVEPFDEELINPASLDVRLGSQLMIEDPLRPAAMIRKNIAHCCREHPKSLMPGQFVLAETVEVFRLPENIAAVFCLKSSRGREGYSHALAGFCDPGWGPSRLTMELHSLSKYHELPLWPGMRIGQMVFHRMSKEPEVSYQQSGHYNGHFTVMDSQVAA
jgi:dCTP deaminase